MRPGIPHRAAGGARPWPWKAAVVAPLLLAALAPFAAAEPAAGPPPLPPVVKTKQRSFSIPFRLPPAASAETAPREIVLDVSKDLGVSWESGGRAAPSAASFTYNATADGEYWFRLRSVDSQGRLRGGVGPDIRVLVDAAGPKLVGRAWKGSDGEVICRFASLDDSINLESVVVEYRSAAQPEWKRVAAQPVLARESPAHLLGEEIWWAGDKTDGLVVRVAVADSAGNQTVKQFPIEATDPRVDQAVLAGELGVPALPGAGGGLATLPTAASLPTPADSPALPSPKANHLSPGSWPAESGSAWQPEVSPHPLRPGASSGDRSVLATNAMPAPTSERSNPLRFTGAANAATPTGMPNADPLAGLPRTFDGSLEYRGRPLRIIRSRRFSWDYELPAPSPASSVRVELWGTRDGGASWNRVAKDDDGTSPIAVVLPEAGLYGFRLEITGADEPAEGPRAGEQPDSWLGVDEEPPRVEIFGLEREKPAATSGEPVAIRIRYSSRDPLLVPKGTVISYAANSDGPWATIVESADDSGEYRWTPDRTIPSRVFIRVESRDAAGNVGSATSTEPVVISAPRAVGRLGGVHVAPVGGTP